MDTNNYSKAYVEVLELINYLPISEYRKIPKEKIEFYKNNLDKSYNFKINPNIDLQKQNFSVEAKAIILNLFMDYFSTEEKKQQIKNILASNQMKREDEKRKLYNPNDIFKNRNNCIPKENLPLQTIPKNKNILKIIFNKIIEFIKK